MNVLYEGKEVYVRGTVISVNSLDNTSMVMIDSEDARAILQIQKDNICVREQEIRNIG